MSTQEECCKHNTLGVCDDGAEVGVAGDRAAGGVGGLAIPLGEFKPQEVASTLWATFYFSVNITPLFFHHVCCSLSCSLMELETDDIKDLSSPHASWGSACIVRCVHTLSSFHCVIRVHSVVCSTMDGCGAQSTMDGCVELEA
jgi:hypothetical protein